MDIPVNFIEVFTKKELASAIRAMTGEGGVIHYHHGNGITKYSFKPSDEVKYALTGKNTIEIGGKTFNFLPEKVLAGHEKRYASIAYKVTHPNWFKR